MTRPSKWSPELKGDLEFILLKALRKDPQERYGTVEQFAEDLQAFLESRRAEVRPTDLETAAFVLVHAVDALEWLRAPFGPGNRLLHVDLHPENVILTKRGPQIIDWEGAAQGPAEADIAMCWVLMRTSEIPGPPAQRRVGAAGQALFSRLSACPRLDTSWLATAAEYRIADPTVTARERTRLARLSGRHHRRAGRTR